MYGTQEASELFMNVTTLNPDPGFHLIVNVAGIRWRQSQPCQSRAIGYGEPEGLARLVG